MATSEFSTCSVKDLNSFKSNKELLVLQQQFTAAYLYRRFRTKSWQLSPIYGKPFACLILNTWNNSPSTRKLKKE